MATPTRLPPCCLLLISPMRLCSGAGQLQVIEAEHGHGQGDEDPGEHRQDPGVLEGRLDIGPEQSGQDPCHRVGQGHGEHIDQGQGERLAGGDARALAGDDARQDGDHREDAGGEGQQEPEAEEDGDHRPEVTLGQDRGDLVLLRDHGVCLGWYGRGGRHRRGGLDMRWAGP